MPGDQMYVIHEIKLGYLILNYLMKMNDLAIIGYKLNSRYHFEHFAKIIKKEFYS